MNIILEAVGCTLTFVVPLFAVVFGVSGVYRQRKVPVRNVVSPLRSDLY